MIVDLLYNEFIGAIVGFVLTMFVFSYLIGDNALFRLAVHIFIGAAAGYSAVIIWQNVLLSQLILPIIAWDGDPIYKINLLAALLLSILLLVKLSSRVAYIGNPIMAFLVGVGAATAIGGAIMGTLLPQVIASINLFDPQTQGFPRESLWLFFIEGGFILLATLSTLIYFHFGARPTRSGLPKRATLIDAISKIGKFFIVLAFGAIFAGVLLSALAAFVSHWNSIIMFFTKMVGG